MVIKQVSVFAENKAGSLAEITAVLAENNINLRALSLADTLDYGILRLIVDQPDKAQKVLTEAGFASKMTDVAALLVDDRPGGLAEALKLMSKIGAAVEYMYAFIGNVSNGAVVVIKIGEKLNEAVEVLTQAGYKLLCEEDVYSK